VVAAGRAPVIAAVVRTVRAAAIRTPVRIAAALHVVARAAARR
jgi:hypothetical protein